MEENRPATYVWHEEEVELVCRPSNEVDCHWLRDHADFGDGCLLITQDAGLYQCMHNEEIVGSIQLATPENQYVHEFHQQNRYYRGWEMTVSRTEDLHLCSDTGKIISKFFMCDGLNNCNNREDEEGCFRPCGAPTVLEHSRLSQTSELYPHGASVTYICDSGFVFRETFSVSRRTCSHGQWNDRPPICQRNVAFGGEGTVKGLVMSGLGPELAVDGKTDSWTMLASFTPERSVTVKLETNTSVDSVLVWASNEEFEVSLREANNTTVCTCSSSEADLPELYLCECPGTVVEPTEVTVGSTAHNTAPFAVAEIAALEAPTSVDDFARLDRPAHGRFERFGALRVKLVCESGYRASCGGGLAYSEAATAECRPVSCSPPPVVPNTVVIFSNGTDWSAVTQYACVAGYQLFPTDQRTEAVCGDDGLWSISYVSCLPDTDTRVVTLRLSEQHMRSMAELRTELEELLTGQKQLLRQLGQMQRRLRRLEDELGLTFDEKEPEKLMSKAETGVEVAEAETEASAEETEDGGEEQQLGEKEQAAFGVDDTALGQSRLPVLIGYHGP